MKLKMCAQRAICARGSIDPNLRSGGLASVHRTELSESTQHNNLLLLSRAHKKKIPVTTPLLLHAATRTTTS